MVVRLSILHAGHPLPPGRFLVLISVRGFYGPRAIEWLEGLGEVKNPMTSLGIESVTFRLAAQSASTNYATACPVYSHKHILNLSETVKLDIFKFMRVTNTSFCYKPRFLMFEPRSLFGLLFLNTLTAKPHHRTTCYKCQGWLEVNTVLQ
jgi:hypothetical protein